MKFKNFLGQKVGLLTVKEHAGSADGTHRWLCVCECGESKIVLSSHLSRSHTTSCGALMHRIKSDAMTRKPEYRVWRGMKSRCNGNDPDYGGRGISVCKRWAKSFDAFLTDMGQRPSSVHTIDRIDVNKGYSPANCRWIPKRDQSGNTRKTLWVNVEGEAMNLKAACQRLGLNYWSVVYHVNKAGRNPQEALSRFAGGL